MAHAHAACLRSASQQRPTAQAQPRHVPEAVIRSPVACHIYHGCQVWDGCLSERGGGCVLMPHRVPSVHLAERGRGGGGIL